MSRDDLRTNIARAVHKAATRDNLQELTEYGNAGPIADGVLAALSGLLSEVASHLQSTRVFLTSREKMHPCGVDIHDELLATLSAALTTTPSKDAPHHG